MHHDTGTASSVSNAPHRALRARHGMRCFAWDLADAGVDEALGEMQEYGVDAVHLALVAPGGRFYCPRNPRRVLMHAADGLFYFQPTLSRYDAIKPRVHHEFGSGALAYEVREACTEHHMAFVAWAELFNNASLTEWHPEAACVNALGDRIAGALCPAHPAARSYAQGLVQDLAHDAAADVIELEHFGYPLLERFVGVEWRGIEIGPMLSFLLSICFCEHCARRAKEMNIEVGDLKRLVERMIRQGLSGDLSERRLHDELSSAAHPLTRYGTMRTATVTTLLDDLLDAVDGSGVVLQPMLEGNPEQAWRAGIELRELRQRVHHAMVVAPAAAPDAVKDVLEEYEKLLAMEHDLAADLRLSALRDGSEQGEPDFAGLIHAAHEAGYERLVLSHFGLASQAELDALAAASSRPLSR